jgi:hypothetical protein
MPTTKTVRIQGTFEISTADGTIECKKVVNNILQVTEASQVFPQTVAGNQNNVPISFGGVTLAKRIFLRVSNPVTVKFNQSTDTGCSIGVGDNLIMSDNGITALYISTGPNPTDVEAIIVG